MFQAYQTNSMRQRGKVKRFCLSFVLVLAACFFLLCLIFFLFPLITSLNTVFFAKNKDEVVGYLLFSQVVKVFLFTIYHTFFSSLLAVVLGLLLAFFCANRRFAFKNFLLSFSAIPFTLPPLILVLSYLLFFGNNGFFFSLLKEVFNLNISSFLYSIAGIVIVQGMYNFPIAMQEITESWQRVPKNEIEAATLLQASPFFIFRTLTLPHILPSIISSFLLIFLFCFFSFVIVLMFGGVGVSTIEVELYKCALHSGNANNIATFFLIEFSFALMLVVLHNYANKKCEIEGKDASNIEVKKMSKIESVIFFLLVLIVIFFLILPLISIFLFSFKSNKSFSAFSLSHQIFFKFSFQTWKHIFSSSLFWRSFFSSMYIGVLTTIVSILATIFYIFCKLFIVKNKWIDIFPFLPLATSSIMLGAGWNFIMPNVSYNVGVVMLICCQSSLFYPFAVAKLNIAVKNAVTENLIDASILLSQSRVKTFFFVVLPLVSKSLLSASAIIFAMSIADASLPLVLGIERFSNLALLLFDYASSYRFAESAAIGTFLLFMSMPVFLFQKTMKKY